MRKVERTRIPVFLSVFAVPVQPFSPVLPLQSVPPGKRPMTLLDLAELSRLLDPQLSPDGRTLTYMRSHADWKLGRPVWHLWRQPIGGDPQ